MKSVLVTGATGFVGRQVVAALARKGSYVIAVTRPDKAQTAAALPGVGGLVTTQDLFAETGKWWQETLRNIDTVVHAAWYVVPGRYLTAPQNLDCLTGTLTLARACVEVGVRRFTGIGTCAEYDSSDGLLRVSTPLKPDTLYAACKASSYMALSQLFQPNDIGFSWCRLFYLYGEGEAESRFVPYLHKCMREGIRADLTLGNQVRDFIDVRDAGEMIAASALGNESGAVNICSGIPVTIRQLAERIADEYGRRDLLNFGGRSESRFDPPVILGFR